MSKEEIIEKIKAYYVLNDDDKIIDYITNLHQEKKQLQERINKAIEVIENYINTIGEIDVNEVLKILVGEDNE